jgi:hypothetical protein
VVQRLPLLVPVELLEAAEINHPLAHWLQLVVELEGGQGKVALVVLAVAEEAKPPELAEQELPDKVLPEDPQRLTGQVAAEVPLKRETVQESVDQGEAQVLFQQ